MSSTTLLFSVCKTTLFLADAWTLIAFLFCRASKSLLFYWSQGNFFLEISGLETMMTLLGMFRRLLIWEIDSLRLLRDIVFAHIYTWVFYRRLWERHFLVFFNVWGLLWRERRLTFFIKLYRSSLWRRRNFWLFEFHYLFGFLSWFFKLLSHDLFLLRDYFRLGFGFLYLCWNLFLNLFFQLMLKHALWLFRRFLHLFFYLFFFFGNIFLDDLIRFDGCYLIVIFFWCYLNLLFGVLLLYLSLCWRLLYFLNTNAYIWLTLFSNFISACLKLLHRLLFRHRLSSSWLFYLFRRVTNSLERLSLGLLKLFEWLLHKNLLEVRGVLKVIIDGFVEIILYFL